MYCGQSSDSGHADAVRDFVDRFVSESPNHKFCRHISVYRHVGGPVEKLRIFNRSMLFQIKLEENNLDYYN